MLRKIFVFVLCLAIGLAFAANASNITFRDGDEWSEASFPAPWDNWKNKTAVSYYNPEGMCVQVNYSHPVGAGPYATLVKSDPSLPDADIDIKVTVRKLDPDDPNSRCVVTVVETGTNAPAIAFHDDDWGSFPFNPIIGEQGAEEGGIWHTDLLVDYMVIYKIYIDSPTASLPNWWQSDKISIHAVISGIGTISKTDYGFTEGNTATVNVDQVGLFDTGGTSIPGRDFFPAELVNIEEL